MLLTDFDDLVLSHIASHLRLNDLINLKKTCRRLKAISETQFKQFTTFDLCHYEWFCEDSQWFCGHQTHPARIEEVLSYIGPYISVLAIYGDASYRWLNSEIERYCTNVKSLVMGDTCDGFDEPAGVRVQAFLKWINNLQLESLTLLNDTSLKSKPFRGITTLKELIMDCYFSDEALVTELYEILEHNVNIETLYIELTRDFNFEIFGKLKNLRHLGIRVSCTEDMIKITPFLKMHEVTKLQVEMQFVYYENTPDDLDSDEDDFVEVPDELNESLKRLAETKTLKALSLKPPDCVLFDLNTSTIRSLHFFELTSLQLQCDLSHDRRYEIVAKVQPNLTNLDLDREQQLYVIVHLIKHLNKLKKFHVRLPATVKKQFLDEDLLIGLSKESTERPTLTVKLRDSDVAVKFRFKGGVHEIITFTPKETFLSVGYEKYRPWCVDEL